MLERAASHNLAEFLLWQGSFERARSLAERADALRERFVGPPQVPDSLLLARICACTGDRAAAQAQLRVARDACGDDEPPAHTVLADAVERWLSAEDLSEWEPVLEAGAELPAEERIEVCDLLRRWARRAGSDAGEQVAIERASEALAATPLWQSRWAAAESG